MAFGEPEALHLAPLLDRIAAEILQCRVILSQIEHSVQDILDAAPLSAMSHTQQKDMQDIDFLSQIMDDLARFLHAAAVEPAVQNVCDLSVRRVLGHLRLDDLRQRLRGKAAAEGQEGAVEYF